MSLIAHFVSDNANSVPPAQRADLFDALAAIARHIDGDGNALAAQAEITAAALREAEIHQLTFSQLLTRAA
jgi:hypothetical protein